MTTEKRSGKKPKSGLASRPPRPKSEEEFVAGDEASTDQQSGEAIPESDLPWKGVRVRDDVVKPYTLRLKEPDMLKLKYIADHTAYSMNSFLVEVATEAIEAKLREIGVV